MTPIFHSFTEFIRYQLVEVGMGGLVFAVMLSNLPPTWATHGSHTTMIESMAPEKVENVDPGVRRDPVVTVGAITRRHSISEKKEFGAKRHSMIF
jgi:predicted subunit of tRNA(5-methylaminomethyl-2-thiouridylate) methyltransferase